MKEHSDLFLVDPNRTKVQELPAEERARFYFRQVLYWMGVVLVVPAALALVVAVVLIVKRFWHAGIFFAAPATLFLSISLMLRILSKHKERLLKDISQRHAELMAPNEPIELHPETKSGAPVSF